MINSELPSTPDHGAPDLVGPRPVGAALLAGVATAIVLAIWVGFYLFVFAPRSIP